ncbi:MAG: beta-propeller fold lactonase family protein [Clostridium sp.]
MSNELTSNLTVYKRNTDLGFLELIQKEIAAHTPVCICFIE